MKKVALASVGEVVDEVLALVPKEGIVVLQGDLASGKTTFVKAFATRLGIAQSVTSPTFSLQQIYGERLYHYDLYNHGFEHFLSLGMLEEFDKSGYHLVEWGDERLIALLKEAGYDVVAVKITKCEKEKRCYDIDKA